MTDIVWIQFMIAWGLGFTFGTICICMWSTVYDLAKGAFSVMD